MRTRSSAVAALLAAVLAGATLAGCGGSTGDDAAQPGGTVSSSPSSAGSSGPSSTPPPPTSTATPSGRVPPTTQPPKTSGAEVTLNGQPEEGVESGCVVMRSGGTLYNLIGGDRKMLQSGRTVVVRGRVATGLMTTCQQGTPFQVSEVRFG